jgi:hypothetical protein
MPSPDEPSAILRLMEARRRYVELRDALPCDCALDRDLHAELTEAIRMLDVKIAETGPANDPRPPPITPGGRSARGRPPARRHRNGR